MGTVVDRPLHICVSSVPRLLFVAERTSLFMALIDAIKQRIAKYFLTLQERWRGRENKEITSDRQTETEIKSRE